ncbi:peptidoglycan-binding protein [Methylobacterium sp. Leaf399]|uniref:NlpC/P60 family protein n=1 Tax=Methylobacterium sp. Leaf399 TaxID=1736364 RepID=UPI0006F3CEAC|nr:TIGR02594 family protein [Methylobacterium sp. Leaf399]KQT14001.1 peptidoglycan-binding protein [Methylobacterium sp. Leaf399]
MDTTQIQRALLARGYDLGPAGADGDAGPKTIAAVTAFQRAAGLVADGIAGPITIKALGAVDTSERRAEPDQPPWLTLAAGEVGTVEGIGKANNPRVVRYFADAGFAGIKDDAVAWCAAFCGAVLHRAGRKPSGSLAARSYEAWGVGLKAPVLGCIATKKRGNSTWQGHVGFVVGASKDQVFLLGGNQSDAVNVAAFKRSEITAFRWPSDVPIPAASTLPTTIAGARSGVSEA